MYWIEVAYMDLHDGVHKHFSSIVSENVLGSEYKFLKQGCAPEVLLKSLTLSCRVHSLNPEGTVWLVKCCFFM